MSDVTPTPTVSTDDHAHYEGPFIEPDFSDPAHVAHLASILLPLVLDWTWVRRRTDRVTIHSDTHLRREITLEFVIPDVCELIGEEVWVGRIPIPITLHRKRVLTGLRVVDASGSDLSILTKSENQPLEQRMLEGRAEAALGHPPAAETVALLRRVTGSEDPSSATAQLSTTNEGRRLLADDVLSVLIEDFEDAFLILVLVEYEIGAAHAIRISYDEYVPDRLGPGKQPQWWELWRLPQWWGWIPVAPGPTTLAFPVGLCASFHAEVVAPPELRFPGPDLVTWKLADASVGHEEHNFEELHVTYVAHANRGDEAYLAANFRTRPPGIARAAEVVGLITSVMFVVAILARHWLSIRPSGDAAAAASLLVSLPAVYSLLALREVRHPLTAQYTEGPRTVIALFGLLALLGGAVLAARFPDAPDALTRRDVGWRSVAWTGITILCCVLTLVAARRRRARW